MQAKLFTLTIWIGVAGVVLALLTTIVLLVQYGLKTEEVKAKDIINRLMIGVTILVVAIPEGLPLACNVDKLGDKYTEAEPRCTCPPYESTLQSSQRWSTECNFSAMLTSWEASTPRRSRGVLVLPTSQHCRGVCGGSPSATPMQILRDGRQVHRGEAEVYLPFLRVKFLPSR